MLAVTSAARSIVEAHERTLDERARVVDGSVPTPEGLAGHLVRLGMDQLGRVPATVLDPACGAGSLLLAAAERLVRLGVDPVEVVERRLIGVERDPSAAAAAEVALRRWLWDHDPSASVRPLIHRTDGLHVVAGDGPVPSGGVDLVVANPPFLDQLDGRSRRDPIERARVTERFGAIGQYCDTAALFLAASFEQLAPSGVVSMLLPTSFLSARDTTAVRDRLLLRGRLLSLWSTDESCVPASVQVCAVVAGLDGGSRAPVELRWGRADRPVARVRPPAPGASWAPLLAVAQGLPESPVLQGVQLGTVATVTAGFRDEFYAICGALEGPGTERAPVVSVGMIDPLELRWSEGTWRMAGRRRTEPSVDLAALRASAPKVAQWVAARRRPKVLVASQGKVIEAVADADGRLVPLTPVLSVEPTSPGIGPWWLLAALSSPPVAALVAAQRCGSGLSGRSVRVSASTLAEVPLPTDRVRWAAGAEMARRAQRSTGSRRIELLAEFASTMTRAHGVEAPGVLEWWWDQLRCAGPSS